MLSQTNINFFLTWRQRRTPFRLAAFPRAGRRHTSYFSPPNGSGHGARYDHKSNFILLTFFTSDGVWSSEIHIHEKLEIQSIDFVAKTWIEDGLFDREANARNGGSSREKHCISVDTWSSLRTWVSVLNLTLDLRYWKRMRHWSRKYLLKLLSESWSWRRFWLVKYLAKYTPSSSSRDVSISCSVGFPGMLAQPLTLHSKFILRY